MGLAVLLALSLVVAIAWVVGNRITLERPRPRAAPPLIPRAAPEASGAPALPLPPPAVDAPRPTCPHAASQMLFVTPMGDFIEVDGVLIEPCGVCHPAGVPFHLRLRPPTTPALSEVTSSVLADWAADGELVDVRIPDTSPPRARITDGSITVVLDLEETSLH